MAIEIVDFPIKMIIPPRLFAVMDITQKKQHLHPSLETLGVPLLAPAGGWNIEKSRDIKMVALGKMFVVHVPF